MGDNPYWPWLGRSPDDPTLSFWSEGKRRKETRTETYWDPWYGLRTKTIPVSRTTTYCSDKLLREWLNVVASGAMSEGPEIPKRKTSMWDLYRKRKKANDYSNKWSEWYLGKLEMQIRMRDLTETRPGAYNAWVLGILGLPALLMWEDEDWWDWLFREEKFDLQFMGLEAISFVLRASWTFGLADFFGMGMAYPDFMRLFNEPPPDPFPDYRDWLENCFCIGGKSKRLRPRVHWPEREIPPVIRPMRRKRRRRISAKAWRVMWPAGSRVRQDPEKSEKKKKKKRRPGAAVKSEKAVKAS